MNIRLQRKKETASALLDYAVILGIVSLVFMSMNIYIKRGIQAKVKDMTDNFIGKEQSVEINPTAVTNSLNDSFYGAIVGEETLTGGSTKVASVEMIGMEVLRRTEDTDVPERQQPLVPAEEGQISPPVRPNGNTGGG